MIKDKKSIKLNSSILDLTLFENSIIIIDSQYAIYIISKDTLDLIKTIRLTKNDLVIHPYSRIFNLSNNYATIPAPSNPKLSILKIVDNRAKQLATLSYHEKHIAVSDIFDDYIATIDIAGRGFVSSKKSGFRAVFKLPNRPDSGSVVRFFKEYLFCAYFDKINYIYNYITHKELVVFESSDVIEDAKFVDDTMAVYVTKCGRVGVLSGSSFENREYFLKDSWLTSFGIYRDKFLVIGDKDGDLSIFSLKERELLFTLELREVGISCVRCFDALVYIGYIDGAIEIYDTKLYLAGYSIHIEMNEFKEASDLAKKNRFLLLQDVTNRFVDKWQDVYKECAMLISKGAEKDAIKKASPFFFNSKIKSSLEELLVQKEKILYLHKLYEDKNFAEIIKEGDRKEWIRELELYTTSVQIFEKYFLKAKMILFENPNDLDRAKKILKSFMGIKSKRASIESLLLHSDKYLESEKYLKDKNFPAYFMLVKDHQFLKDAPVYKKAKNLIDTTFQKAVIMIQDGEFNEAFKSLTYIKKCGLYKDEIREQEELLRNYKAFSNFIKEGELKKAFSLFDRFPYLKYRKEYEELINRYGEILLESMEMVDGGHPSLLLEKLEELIGVNFCFFRVESLMIECYLNEIKNIKDKKSTIELQGAFDKLIYIFGLNRDILSYAKELGITTFAYSRAMQPSKDREYLKSLF